MPRAARYESTSRRVTAYRAAAARVETDTLESIAAKFNTTVDDLLTLNPDVDPLALSPGERIRVS